MAASGRRRRRRTERKTASERNRERECVCVSDRFRVQKVKPHIQRHRERERRGRGESSFVCFIFFFCKTRGENKNTTFWSYAIWTNSCCLPTTTTNHLRNALNENSFSNQINSFSSKLILLGRSLY